MRLFTRNEGTIPSVAPGSALQTRPIATDLQPMLKRLGYAAALVIGLSALVFIPPDRNSEEIARLERLAPEIERARVLPQETRDSINRLVTRQMVLVGTGGQMNEIRRKAAIERVTSAIRAKQDGSTGSLADIANR